MPKKNPPPVNRELFEKWLPDFQDGLLAKTALAAPDFDDLPRSERIEIRRRSSAGDTALMAMYDRISILAERIIQREMDRPRTFHVLIEREDLEAAAYEGIYAALQRMDLEKTGGSVVNYVLQYVDTRVTRAALKMEASAGLSPSRLRLFKKIAAVRRKMRKGNDGKEPSDEQVLEFFHSGKADFRSMNGASGSNKTSFKSNKNIKLKDIVAQHELDDGHPFHSPVTDAHEIDASVSHSDSDPAEMEFRKADSERFWHGYMTYLGLPSDEEAVLAEELQLYKAHEDTSGFDDHEKELMGREFLRLIQNENKGHISLFSAVFTQKHGDGFWRVFVEHLTADSSPTGTRIPSVRLVHLHIHPKDIVTI